MTTIAQVAQKLKLRHEGLYREAAREARKVSPMADPCDYGCTYTMTHKVTCEEGTVTLHSSLGGNSRQTHARVTIKLNGKRISKADAEKLTVI